MKPLETLRALGTGGEAPAEAKQRVYGALMASLGAAAAASSGAAAGAAAGAGKSDTLAPAAAPLIAGLTSTKGMLVAMGIWLTGVGTGAALYGALHSQEMRVVYVDRPVLSTSVAAPIAATASASTAMATAPSLPAAPTVDTGSKRAAAASAFPTSELARERGLLDLARANAARGEPALVLRQTELHRAQFPRGKLSEEREAMAIRALLSLGRADEARARAQAFRLAYPNSFLAPVIDSALSAP